MLCAQAWKPSSQHAGEKRGDAGLHRELCSVLCSDLNGKEIQKRGDIRRRRADSLCCAEDTETTLSSSYTPIRINLKRKKEPSLARGSLRIPGASDGVEFPEVSLIWEV